MAIEQTVDHSVWLKRAGGACTVAGVPATVEVGELRTHPEQQSFALTFTTEPEHQLNQRTATVAFDDGLNAEVFVVPISETQLEAVFTRLIEPSSGGQP